MNSATGPIAFHSLAEAPWHVLVHLACAILAVLLGTAVLLRRKGDFTHNVMSWSRVVLMGAIAMTSFLIQARGHLSLIHVFSVVVLVTVPLGLVHIRHKRVEAHRRTMSSVFAGLVIAGAFTLLPYRMLGQLLFAA